MRSKKFVIVSLILALVIGLSFSAFAEKNIGVEDLKLSAGSVGGSWYPLAGAMAEVINKEYDGSPATGIPGGSVSNPGIIAKGQATIGFSYSSYLAAANIGMDPYTEKMTNLRGIMKILPMYIQVLVDKDLPFDTFDELFEQKYPVNLCPLKPGVGDFWAAQKIFEFYGYKLEDVKEWGGNLQFVGSSEAVNLWRDRHIDMYNRQGACPTSDVYEMMVARPAKILPISGDLKKSLIDAFGMSPMIVPAGTYPGIDKDVETVGMSAVLFCRDDLSEEVVYNFTKVILENIEYLSGVYAALGELDMNEAWQNLGAPLHPGAEKYFREKGYIK